MRYFISLINHIMYFRFTLTICILFCLAFTKPEVKEQFFENGKLKASATIDHGMFNGTYTSWYSNGIKKAEGNFSNNQRNGKWTVWDSSGNVRIIRNYSDAFTFVTELAKKADGTTIQLPAYPNYISIINSVGAPDYPIVEYSDILAYKDIWRKIDKNDDNAILFENNRLQNIISNYLNEKGTVVFDDHKLNNVYDLESIKKKINNPDWEIIGYRIYEGWNFYKTYQLSDYRIMAITPIIRDNKSGLSEDLGWLRFVDLRGAMEATVVETTSGSKTTLDAIFRTGSFSSVIYRESNIYNRKIEDYKKGKAITEESDKIEFNLIDMEHTLWLEALK